MNQESVKQQLKKLIDDFRTHEDDLLATKEVKDFLAALTKGPEKIEKIEKAKNAQYIEMIEEHRKEKYKYREKLLELQDKQYEELTNYFNLKERRLAEIDHQFKLNTKISLVSAAFVAVE